MTNEQIYARAVMEGLRAGNTVAVEPMVVNYTVAGVRKVEVIEDGLCGFASIHFEGNTSFGKWAKGQGVAKKNYGGKGLYIWVGEFNQSYTKKQAYASAFARVLMENGINAYMDSRLD